MEESNSISLKCMCCGKTFNQESVILVPSSVNYFNIECPFCGLKTDWYDTPYRAFEAWKNREFANWTESAKAFYRKK